MVAHPALDHRYCVACFARTEFFWPDIEPVIVGLLHLKGRFVLDRISAGISHNCC